MYAYCENCHKEVDVTIEDSSFDYAGTHCNHGQSGTQVLPVEYLCPSCGGDFKIEDIYYVSGGKRI